MMLPALALALLAGATGEGIVTSTVTSTAPRTLALTVSGGVSLGVYEAGFLYYLDEALKQRRDQLRVELFTGASAGSANALISLIASCSEPNPLPSSGLGWKTWMPLGYRELFDGSKVTAISVFHTGPMARAMDEAWTVWTRGLPEGCDRVFGVSVTRLERYPVRVNADFTVPRVEEKFAVRIQGRGPGRPPRVTNYADPYTRFDQVLLNLLPDEGDLAASRHNFEQLRTLLFASAAFPLAFPPVRIPHCVLRPLEPGQRPGPDRLSCLQPERDDLFIDGGVFDNSPMRYANSLAQLGLRRGPDGDPRWRDLTEAPAADRARRDPIQLYYLDPTRYAFPRERSTSARDVDRGDGLLALVGHMTSDLVATARSKELYALVQESPDLGDRMRLSMGYFPKASEELGAFLGFFDPEFRRFDFYLGMYDAWAQLDLTEEVHPGDDRMQAEWRPLACLIGWFSTGREALRRHCEGEDLRNFRILVQSSLDRLYDACQGVDPRELDPPHPHCARAAAGLPPPRVDGVVEVDLETRRRAKGESKFDHFMRLLDAYRFEFEDLGLDASHAHLGRVKIRRKALGMITALSEAQPSTADRALLLTAGRQLVNTIAYEPPKNWAYVMLGTAVEVGASILPFEWDQSWARLNLALDVKDLTTLVSSSDPRTRLTLALGGELELLFITTPTFAPQIGARVGYQFGTRDAFGVKTCTEARALGENQNCSQVVLQNYYSLAILERFRAQLLLELYPQSFAFASERIDLHLMFGVQLF